MKKILYPFIAFCFMLPVLVKAQYSNASVSGPWIVRSDNYVYIIFDGAGTINEIGTSDDTLFPVGTYSVNASGAFTGTVNMAQGSQAISGQLQSDSFAVFNATGGKGPFYMFKVTNVGALAGTWSGYVMDSQSLAPHNVQMVVNSTGNITSLTGFPFVSGKIFTARDTFAGYLTTTDTACIFTVWQFNGYYNDSLTGRADLGSHRVLTNNCNTGGHLSLKRAATGIANIPSADAINVYPVPFSNGVSITAPAGFNLAYARVFDLCGRLLNNIILNGSNTVTVNLEQLPAGMYVLAIVNDSGTTVTRRVVKQ